MVDALLALFTMPWPDLSGWSRLALMLPLTAAIALVYKSVKCRTVREIPLASLTLWVTIVIGMYVVGIGLMITYELLG